MRILTVIFLAIVLVGCAEAPRRGAARSPAPPVAVATARPAAASPRVRHTVTAGGAPLALWEKRPAGGIASRGAIVLVHGRSWSSLPNFDLQGGGDDRSVMNALVRAGYVAYALDLRGYGGSPRDATGWLTPDRAADDVHAVLNWVRAREQATAGPVLVGYSRGSSVALLVAQRHPESVSKVVLYGFPAEGMAAPVPPSSGDAPPPRAPNTTENAASDFVTPGALPRAVVDAYVKEALASDPVHADWKNEDQFVFDPTKVRVPTLLLYGAGDKRAASPEVARFFTGLATQDRAWTVLPNSDHAAHVEDAQRAWIDAIRAFVESPRSR